MWATILLICCSISSDDGLGRLARNPRYSAATDIRAYGLLALTTFLFFEQEELPSDPTCYRAALAGSL